MKIDLTEFYSHEIIHISESKSIDSSYSNYDFTAREENANKLLYLLLLYFNLMMQQ